MHTLAESSTTAPVPTGLLVAAIDYINVVRPAPPLIETMVTAFALRLDYDHATASALAIRIRATARMLADARWPSMRQIGLIGDAMQRARFEAVVQQFIACHSLEASFAFDLGALQKALLAALPHHGQC